MLASFLVVQPEPEEIWLLCSADLLQDTLKRLAMFILRAKVKLADASHELSLYGLATPTEKKPDSSLPELGEWHVKQIDCATHIGLPMVANVQRQLVIAKEPIPLRLPALPLAQWDWLAVRSGIALVTQGTRDQYVPQMFNYESIGGVDFAKGCYPGQEVVSRSQFRGTLKRRLHLIHSTAPLATSAQVASESNPTTVVGEIVAAAPNPADGWDALAVLRTEATAAPLLDMTTGAAILVEALPYTLRTDF